MNEDNVLARLVVGVVVLTVVLTIVVSGCGSSTGTPRLSGQDKPTASHLYFYDADSIWSISLVGEPKKRGIIGVDSEIGGVATTSKYLFWTSYRGCFNPDRGTFTRCNGLFRVDRDGTHAVQLVGELEAPSDPVVVGDHVYWIDLEEVGRAKIDGSAIERSFIEPVEEDHGEVASSLATNGTYLYFSRCAGAAIGRVKLDGTELDREFISAGEDFCPGPLDYADGRLYWSQMDDDGRTLIGRASADGGKVERAWLNVGPGNFQLAAGSGMLFWTWGGGAGSPTYIGRLSLDGKILDRRFVRGWTADVGP